MKCKQFMNLATILLAPVLLFSCTAPIDIQTDHGEPVPVIYGFLTDEFKYQYVQVTKSAPFFHETENHFFSDAKVWVTSSTGEEYPFVHDTNGIYFSQSRFSAVQGETYRLSVELDFRNDGIKELYEAETTMLPPTPADSISVTSLNIMGIRHYSLNVSMREPVETANHYLFKFFINDSISNEIISDYIIFDDELINGRYLAGLSIKYFNAESDFEENDRDDYLVKPGDKISLQILNIEKGYFTFIKDCSTEKYGSNPFFGGPPTNIYTNLSNDAVGYFSSYCMQEIETVVPE